MSHLVLKNYVRSSGIAEVKGTGKKKRTSQFTETTHRVNKHADNK